MAWDVAELEVLKHPLLLRRLRWVRGHVHTRVADLRCAVATSPEPVPFAERGRLRARRVREGSMWGRAYTCAWFHVTGQVPEHPRGRQVALILDTDGEALVLDPRGTVVGAVTSRLTPVERHGSARGKTRFELTDDLAPAGRVDLWLDAGFNGKLVQPYGVARIRELAIVTVDDAWEALHDDWLSAAYALVAASRPLAQRYSDALDASWRHARRGDVPAARAALEPVLRGTPDPSMTFAAVGHGHLDMAWLWPVRETRRKAHRTLRTQLDALDTRPGAVFGISQPQQIAWVEHDDPDLFDRLRSAVDTGRVELQGGFWVEPDTNLPSGESLIRQAVHGQRYLRERFGQTVRICWLPDTFGYSGALPQIIRGAGMPAFMTTKLAWNEHTDFPHRSFVWEGIDGSRVLVHMPPEGTYTSSATGLALAAAKRKYPERDVAPEALLVYGSGDGGGGPGPAHYEALERSASLEGFPAVHHSSAQAFFDRLAAHEADLPVWRGELYLEKHQGTFTTHARTKRWNRLLERRLHDAELLGALAWLRGREWPGTAMDEVWREVLLYQFHDMLPGSSVGRVHRECEERYAVLDARVREETSASLASLAGGGEAGGRFEVGDVVVNTTPAPRRGVLQRADGWFCYDVEPFGAQRLSRCDATYGDDLLGRDAMIGNDLLEVTFAADGTISSLVDLASGREHSGGFLSRLVVHKDPWTYFDAWDIKASYVEDEPEVLVPESAQTLQDGPRVVRRQRYRHGRSRIEQDIVLTPGQPYVLVELRVDWHETWRMLRVEHRPSAWADEATFEIQNGHLTRSTREGTPQERAQFEVCAHRWVDVTSPDGFGFTVLNDGIHGHRVKRGVVSLNLLRSPVYPDRTADRGRHVLRYAVLPHEGALDPAVPTALATDLGSPLVLADEMPWERAPFRVVGEGVVLETVKVAEDGEAVVVRLHEVRGRGASVSLTVPEVLGEAVDCTLLEEPSGRTDADLAALAFGPFEIRTLRLAPRLSSPAVR